MGKIDCHANNSYGATVGDLQCFLYYSAYSTPQVYRIQPNWLKNPFPCHDPSETALFLSLLFSITSSVFHLPLKIPLFWKIIFNSSRFGTAQHRKSCPVTTDMVKCSSADRKLHAVTMTRRNGLALKFHLKRLLWSSSMWLKTALKTISSHTRFEYIKY